MSGSVRCLVSSGMELDFDVINGHNKEQGSGGLKGKGAVRAGAVSDAFAHGWFVLTAGAYCHTTNSPEVSELQRQR